jgi:hypothetical protein
MANSDWVRMDDGQCVLIPENSVIRRCPNRDLEIIQIKRDGTKEVTVVNGRHWMHYTAGVIER